MHPIERVQYGRLLEQGSSETLERYLRVLETFPSVDIEMSQVIIDRMYGEFYRYPKETKRTTGREAAESIIAGMSGSHDQKTVEVRNRQRATIFTYKGTNPWNPISIDARKVYVVISNP